MARLQRGRARRQAERSGQRSQLMFWLRLVVAVVLVAVLLVQVIRVLEQSYWRQSELDTAIYRFGQTAMLVNSEWYRTGREGPVQVQLGGQNTARTLWVAVNERGWPLGAAEAEPLAALSSSQQCENLWRLLSQAPDLLTMGLAARWHSDDEVCVFSFQGDDVFMYRPSNGHVQTL